MSISISPTKLQKYGSVQVYGNTFVYLELDGFKKGDKIYIQVSFNLPGYYLEEDSLSLLYEETNDNTVATTPSSQRTSKMSRSGSSYTFYYSIKLQGNYNYLLIKSPVIVYSGTDTEITTLYTIKHTKYDYFIIIIIVVVVVVILIIAAIVGFRIYRRRKLAAESGPTTTAPLQPYYNTQPQQGTGYY